MSLIGMCYLEPPHIIVRKGLIAGIEYPLLAEHMSEFMARTLYFTSLLYRSTMEHKCAVAEFCGNVELCRLTEQVVFSDPYNKVSQYNHWTSPYLARDAEALQEDNVFKLEVAELKSKRIVDVAHVEDFESITDASRRADCECWALEVAKLLLKEMRKFDAIT